MKPDKRTAREKLSNVDIEAARRTVTEVSQHLDGLAAQVWAFGLAEGPRRATAIVAQMGAELAVGAVQLYAAERWYAGAALVRQLIEVEYLLFLFASDDDEPVLWLGACPSNAKSALFRRGPMPPEGNKRTLSRSGRLAFGARGLLGHAPRGHRF